MQDKHRHELTLLTDVTSDGTLASIEAWSKKYCEVLICITHPSTDGIDLACEGSFYTSDATSSGIYMWSHIGGAVGGSRAVLHCDLTHNMATAEAWKMPTTYHAPSETDRRIYRWYEPEGAYISSFFFRPYSTKYINWPEGTRIQIYVANVEEETSTASEETETE